MRRTFAACLAVAAVAAAAAGAAPASPAPRKTLTAFASEQELADLFRRWAAEAERRRDAQRAQRPQPGALAQPSAPAPAPAAEAAAAAASKDESVTNVQHAGVDEGGIVKVHGDHLVVLRRGRLFTVNIGDGALAPVSSIDAFGPDVEPAGAWYDEMLVAGDTVVVIGYSYRRGGTEIGLFDIDGAGKLAYRATHHLRSNDYYSSRNYASRLLGNKLVFYTPLYLRPSIEQPLARFPALRRWRAGATDADFRRIARPTRIYRPLSDGSALALHTVTVCDLGAPELSCEATAVMGPTGRVFYVSPTAVYVWMTEWRSQRTRARSGSRSLVYRLPLDGGDPTALRASGSPIDQFSFLESADRHLNVLVRANAAGEGMWGSEVTAGDVALMRVSLDGFRDDAPDAARSAYAGLPRPEGYTSQNRFVGDWVLYGSGSGWGRPRSGTGRLFAYRWAGGGEPVALELGHGVDRIEALGKDAVVVGTDGRDLHFSPMALAGGRAALAPRYTRHDAAQGELRSHGFFYKQQGERSGLLGLPVREGGSAGHRHLRHGSAAILFLKNDALRLSELGDLESRAANVDDGCRASCVDWYGNARPLFLRGRVFALLGYELVEGELDDGRIRERRRVSFAPSAPAIAR